MYGKATATTTLSQTPSAASKVLQDDVVAEERYSPVSGSRSARAPVHSRQVASIDELSVGAIEQQFDPTPAASPSPVPSQQGWLPTAVPICRRVFGVDLGDPVSAIALGPSGCMAGTLLGRVWFTGQETEWQAEQLAGYYDEGVRGAFLSEEIAYAACAESCRGWSRMAGHPQAGSMSFRGADNKAVQSVRQVLLREHLACVLFPMSTLVVNLLKREHQPRSFKLLDLGSSTEVIPCDFDGQNLLLIDRSRPSGEPVLRVVQLEQAKHSQVDKLDEGSLLSLAKLWRADCLVYVKGNRLHMYNHLMQKELRQLRGHSAEIIAVDSQDPQTIVTLAANGTVKLWDGDTGRCLLTVDVPEASFFLGFPYHICRRGHFILLSADQGVFLVELQPGTSGV